MARLVSERKDEPWRRRLFLPNYQIQEAARYAKIAPQTVVAWHKSDTQSKGTLSAKERRAALSYMQLIEIAVVAAFRKSGISLKRIRDAREYVSQQLKAEFPFAEYRFKTEGRHLLLSYDQIEGEKGRGKHLEADRQGQLGWDEILRPLLKGFEYEHEGIVVRWHVGGPSSGVVIDPRISFGAPTVGGVPTWVVNGRWEAGESAADIAEDFGLSEAQVRQALEFEGTKARRGKKSKPSIN